MLTGNDQIIFLISVSFIFIDHEAREIVYLVASVRPPVSALTAAECSKEQRRVIISPRCVSSGRADAVDRLLRILAIHDG